MIGDSAVEVPCREYLQEGDLVIEVLQEWVDTKFGAIFVPDNPMRVFSFGCLWQNASDDRFLNSAEVSAEYMVGHR